MKKLLGHHHISMYAKNAKETNTFYEKVLGLRRVKMTVNQDDPTMYHLFYGDRTGIAGSALTFFEMPFLGSTYQGTNAITRIGLVLSSKESFAYWEDRLQQYGIPFTESSYANRKALHIKDKDGLALSLQLEPGANIEGWEAWAESDIPEAYQIKGIGTVEIKVRRLHKFTRTLTEGLGYQLNDRKDGVHLFSLEQHGIFSEILAVELDGPRERQGRGAIHHLALRVREKEELVYWQEKIRSRGFQTTEIIDRFYFQCFYFRESNGIMFELATDGPGFTVDCPVESLGQKLELPPFLEKHRKEIESQLTPLS